MMMSVYLLGFGVGFMLAQLSGVLVLSGVAFIFNGLLVNASGAGE